MSVHYSYTIATLDAPPTSDLNSLAIDIAEERTAHGKNGAGSFSRRTGATERNVLVRLGVDGALTVCNLGAGDAKGDTLTISCGDERSGLLRPR